MSQSAGLEAVELALGYGREVSQMGDPNMKAVIASALKQAAEGRAIDVSPEAARDTARFGHDCASCLAFASPAPVCSA